MASAPPRAHMAVAVDNDVVGEDESGRPDVDVSCSNVYRERRTKSPSLCAARFTHKSLMASAPPRAHMAVATVTPKSQGHMTSVHFVV
ncbi:hypothetical protein EYF80_039354 [Liparis tanakae]|uniref:Uncharacterized protein n=1 Tax=Liparis tanakae TaxID=230148 RepID=A0A4Z2GA90_9TELE|nr:hypothetical protein EYF80_039354 [Liparis tanakae]